MGNKLDIKTTKLNGIFIINSNSYKDDRGEFIRLFCEDELKDIFQPYNIKQVNYSKTYKKGSVRGLHFQYEPDCEIKIIKCIKGKILDIVVDIRQDSPTFLQTFLVELSEEKNNMIYISKGFAHGFQTLEDDTQLIYFHSNIYNPNNESALNIQDPKLNIKLPLDIIDISERDKEHLFLDNNFKGIKI